MTATLPVKRRRMNILIDGKRTTLSLEEAVWDALMEICRREQISLDEFCELVAKRRGRSSIASALRVACLAYLRALGGNSPSPNPFDATLHRIGPVAATVD